MSATCRPAGCPHLDAQQLPGGGGDALLRPRGVVLQVEPHILGCKVQLHFKLCKKPADGRAEGRLAGQHWQGQQVAGRERRQRSLAAAAASVFDAQRSASSSLPNA